MVVGAVTGAKGGWIVFIWIPGGTSELGHDFFFMVLFSNRVCIRNLPHLCAIFRATAPRDWLMLSFVNTRFEHGCCEQTFIRGRVILPPG